MHNLLKLLFYIAIGLLFNQCKNNEEKLILSSEKLEKNSNETPLQNKELLPTLDKNTDTSLQWLYPCEVTAEMMFYIKNGKFFKGIGSGHLRGEYSNDSLNIQIGYKDCKLLFRHIISSNTKSYSYAKYYKGGLISYDSINDMGENVISYMYGRRMNDSLPKYLKLNLYKDVSRKTYAN